MNTLVITGGSSGIGKATAQLFSEKGWRVFELSRSGQSTDSIRHITCDVTRPEETRAAVREIIDRVGHIDVFISNAGYGISGAIEFTTSEDAHRQFEVNFFGALNSVQAVLPYMRERKAGRIIFTSASQPYSASPTRVSTAPPRQLSTPSHSPCRTRYASLASMSVCSCPETYPQALPQHAINPKRDSLPTAISRRP